MKIIKNTTNLDNKKLQSLFCFIHRLIAKHEGKLRHWKSLRVRIENRSFGYSGRAYLGKVYYSSRVPKDKQWDILLRVSEDTKKDMMGEFSQLFAHELMHSYGYPDTIKGTRRRAFSRDPLDDVQLTKLKLKFGATNFIKVEEPKQPKDVVVIRYARMLKNKKLWEKKLKFASSKYKKYSKQVRNYEKQYKERIN